LEIVPNELVHDLEPLARLRHLRKLTNVRVQRAADLSALARTLVESPTIHTVTKTMSSGLIDLRTLASARIHHLSIQHPDFAHGLRSLPADLPLTDWIAMSVLHVSITAVLTEIATGLVPGRG
jgi:hypothetical protein